VKTSMKRISLAIALSLALGFALPAGLRGWERPVLAQAAGSASTPEAQSPAKDEQEQDENDAYRKSPMVEKLGGMMGMNKDQAATAFEVFNFALLATALGYALAKFLPKAIRNRNTAIQKHLVDARTATEEARIRLSGVEALPAAWARTGRFQPRRPAGRAKQTARVKAMAREMRFREIRFR